MKRALYNNIARLARLDLSRGTSRDLKTICYSSPDLELFARKAYEFLIQHTHREWHARKNMLKIHITTRYFLKKKDTDIGMSLDSDGAYRYVRKNL